MDHVPLPNKPFLGRAEIPFLCEQPYDGGSIETYPARVGWLVDCDIKPTIFRCNDEPVSERKIGAFLQTWLYFGLLDNVLPGGFDAGLFRARNSLGDYILSTESLEDVVQSWLIHAWEHNWADGNTVLIRWAERCHNCLVEARRVVLSIFFDLEKEPDDLLSKICIVIAALVEHLGHVVNSALELKGLRKLYRGAFHAKRDKLWNPWAKSMVSHGWCSSRLRLLVPVHSQTSLLWYYANLSPPAMGKTHSECTDHECFPLQLDPRTYSSAHTLRQCNCKFTGPRPSEVVELLETGGLPLVSIHTVRGRHIEIRLESKKDNLDFVAISHVWADGNGNHSSNTLPSCSLQQIQCYVNALRDPRHKENVPFWMDTMCLPVQPKHIRQRAIANMDDAFKHATAVLVLDKYLRSVNAAQLTTAEMLARIAASNWTLRMWTFLEGRLAKYIFFQFKDRAVDMRDTLMHHLQATVDWQDWSPEQSLAGRELDRSIILCYNATRLSDRNVSADRRDLADIQIALSTRTTSWKSDEPLCLGHLFDLDVKKIVETTQDRMQVFWSLFPHIPSNLIFASGIHKSTAPGFRWAPSSFMIDPVGGFRRAIAIPSDDAVLDENGLVVSFTAFQFLSDHTDDKRSSKNEFLQCCINGDPATTNSDAIHIQDELGYWYKCTIEYPWHQDPAIPKIDAVPAIIISDSRILTNEATINTDDLCAGLFVTTTGELTAMNVISVKTHNQIMIARVVGPMRRCLDAISVCVEDIGNAIADDPIEFGAELDVGHPVDRLVPLLMSHSSKEDLLEAYKEKFPPSTFKLVDEQLLFLCGQDMVQFLKHGNWYKVKRCSEQLSWCVD